MAGAFLHKKSALDAVKDQYHFENPITQRKTARSWDNPITRHRREREIRSWAKSFAGKSHYRKLARFNAMHEASDYFDASIRLKIEDDDSPKLKKFMGKYVGHSIETYFEDLDRQLPANVTGENVKKGYIPKRYWGQYDAYCDKYGCSRDEGYVPGFEDKVADVLCGGYGCDQEELQNFFDSHFSYMYDLHDSTDLTFMEKAKLVLAKFKDWMAKPSEAHNSVSPYLVEIAHSILRKEYGWSASTAEDVASWLSDHKKTFEHAYGEALRNMEDDEYTCVKAALKAVFSEEEDGATRAEIAMCEGLYVVFKDGDGFSITPKANYDARVQDANKISHFSRDAGFETSQDVIDYCKKYGRGDSTYSVEEGKSLQSVLHESRAHRLAKKAEQLGDEIYRVQKYDMASEKEIPAASHDFYCIEDARSYIKGHLGELAGDEVYGIYEMEEEDDGTLVFVSLIDVLGLDGKMCVVDPVKFESMRKRCKEALYASCK